MFKEEEKKKEEVERMEEEYDPGIWKTTLAKYVKEDDVLFEIYYDLLEKYIYFEKRDNGRELDQEQAEKEFDEYLIQFWVVGNDIQVTAGEDAKALAEQPPWLYLHLYDFWDEQEVVEAVKNLPEDD